MLDAVHGIKGVALTVYMHVLSVVQRARTLIRGGVSCVTQDYRDELAAPACSKQVHILTQRATQDIRFDEPLADACYEDRSRLCDGVQPVHLLSTSSCQLPPEF